MRLAASKTARQAKPAGVKPATLRRVSAAACLRLKYPTVITAKPNKRRMAAVLIKLIMLVSVSSWLVWAPDHCEASTRWRSVKLAKACNPGVPSLNFVNHFERKPLQLWTSHARRWRSCCGGGCCPTAQRSSTASSMVRQLCLLSFQQGLVTAI